jgi:predicted metal-dependent enzyme (double-stranded beta helix superfamily)
MSVSSHVDGVPAAAARQIIELATGTGYADLPARDLDQSDLLEIAATLAAAPEQWREHVAFDDDERHYVCLYRDAHVDVWLLCWTRSNDTGWHDHDLSSGSVAVVEGRLIEHVLAVGAPNAATIVGAGQVFSFGPDHIHRLAGFDDRSVSVHAYSPPLWRMGQYAVSSTGVLRRTSVSYADELRPLDEVAPASSPTS